MYIYIMRMYMTYSNLQSDFVDICFQEQDIDDRILSIHV